MKKKKIGYIVLSVFAFIILVSFIGSSDSSEQSQEESVPQENVASSCLEVSPDCYRNWFR
jgi:hypothetical protein